MTMADRIGILSEGGLVQVGTPGEIYERPNCRFGAGFIGETNLFHGRIEGDRPAAVIFRSRSSSLAGAGRLAAIGRRNLAVAAPRVRARASSRRR